MGGSSLVDDERPGGHGPILGAGRSGLPPVRLFCPERHGGRTPCPERRGIARKSPGPQSRPESADGCAVGSSESTATDQRGFPAGGILRALVHRFRAGKGGRAQHPAGGRARRDLSPVAAGAVAGRLPDDPQEVQLRAGDLLILPHGDGHRLGSDLQLAPVSADALVWPEPAGGIATIVHGGGGRRRASSAATSPATPASAGRCSTPCPACCACRWPTVRRPPG